MSKKPTAKKGTTAYSRQLREYQRHLHAKQQNPEAYKAQGVALKAAKNGKTLQNG